MSSIMPHNQQAVEQPKRDCRHNEEIHRRDPVGMIMKERLPSSRWWPSTPGHIVDPIPLKHPVAWRHAIY